MPTRGSSSQHLFSSPLQQSLCTGHITAPFRFGHLLRRRSFPPWASLYPPGLIKPPIATKRSEKSCSKGMCCAAGSFRERKTLRWQHIPFEQLFSDLFVAIGGFIKPGGYS